MGKAAKKRPAAAGTETKTSKRHQAEYDKFLIEAVEDPFDQVKYVEALCTHLGVSKGDGQLVPWASAFDGSNAPGQVMKVMKDVLNIKPRQICGAENCRAAAFYSLRNYQCQHLFQDATSLSQSSGFCWSHGKTCSTPSCSNLAFFVGGFVCKSTSKQHVGRFRSDPCREGAESMSTFNMMLNVLGAHRPKFWVLENVMGATMPRHCKSTASEGSNGAGDTGLCEEMSKFKTPLDYYLHCLSAKLSGFTVAVAELVSAPLPEDRKRLWILGSAASDYTAQQWKEDVLALGELQLPRHHLRGFFKLYGQKASQAEQGGQDSSKPSWQLEQKYAASFSSSVEQAVNAGRLPKNFTPPPRHARPSLKWGAGLSPWAQANCDVYHEILTQMENDMIKEHGPLPRTPFPVADIGQSTFRGATSLSGLWGTMCTSSKLMRMDTWEILGGKGGLGVLGNNMTDKSVLGLSESELSSLAGNAMAFTQLARVLLPVLAQYLSK